MSMALWKLPHLAKQEVIGATRPRFEFVHPTDEEFSTAYDHTTGARVPGRNEISTTAVALDKALMKLAHIGPPETRGRLLKLKYGEVRATLRSEGLLDYSDQIWHDRNPTWTEFKTAFEGPGADNVERTTKVLRELPEVLRREQAAKELMFWQWLCGATKHELRKSPHFVVCSPLVQPFMHGKTIDEIVQLFQQVAGTGGVPTLADCIKLMPTHEVMSGVCIPYKDWVQGDPVANMPVQGLKELIPSFVAMVAADVGVWSSEEEARAMFFWNTFNEISQGWTKRTGKRYYVDERPNRTELLEVMSIQVESGTHSKPGVVVEAYYALRRENFVKGFAKIAADQAAGCMDAQFKYEMSACKTGWWDVSMPYQACLVCGTVCLDGKTTGEQTWDNSNAMFSKDRGYGGMMVETIGQDYAGTAQVPTMADGSFQAMAQHSSTIHIKVISEFAEEEFGPYQTDESGAIMSVGRFNLVQPARAWPTVLKPGRSLAR